MTYRKFSFSLMGIITGLLCLLAVLLSTPWGTQLSLFFVNHLSPLEIEYHSGALLNNLRLERVTYKGDRESIHANDAYLQLHLRCLWQRQLCIDELSVASLLVKMNTNENQIDIAPAVKHNPQHLPFKVKLDKLIVTKATIESPTAIVTLSDFVSVLSIGGSDIHVVNSQLNVVQIELLGSTQLSSLQQAVHDTDIDWPLNNLPTLYSHFNLIIPKFGVKKLKISETLPDQQQIEIVTLEDTFASLSWYETKLSIKEISSNLTPFGAFSVSGQVNLAAPYALDVALNSQISQSDLPLQLSNSEQKVLVKGGLDDLSVHVKSKGSLALTGALTVDALSEHLPYKLNLDVTQFIVLEDLATVMTPSTLHLVSEGDLNEHKLNLNSVITGLGYQNALFELDGVYRKQQLQINALRVQEPDANNQLDISGEVSFGEHYTWDVNFNSTGFTLPPIHPDVAGRIRGNIQSSGFWQADKWSINIKESELSGEINGLELKSVASLHFDHHGQLADSHLALNYGNSSLTLRGYADENWHVKGSINIDDMTQWHTDIEGQYSATLDISGAVEKPDIFMRGIANEVSYLDGASEHAEIEVNYSPNNKHKHRIEVTTPALTWANHTLEHGTVLLQGDILNQSLNLDWQGESSLSLLLNGEYSTVNQTWTGQVSRVKATVLQQEFTPDQTILLEYNHDSNDVEVSSHCWLSEDVGLCLAKDATFSAEKGELALNFDLDSQFLSPLMPEMFQLTNQIEGKLNFGWQQQNLSSLSSTVLIKAGDLQVKKDGSSHQLIQWQNGNANIFLEQGQLVGRLGVFSSEQKPTLELDTRMGLADGQWQDSRLIVHDFNVASLQPLIPELSLLEGQLTTNVSFSGAFDQPNIFGQAKLNQGHAKLVNNINTLTNMNVEFDFNGLKADVSADMLLNQGAVQVSGEANWKDSLMLDMNIDGQSLSLSSPPQMTFVASPNINAKITPSGVNLTGVIEVHKGKVTFDELPQDKVTLSNDVIIVNDDGEQVEQDKAFNVSTDIRLIIADAFQVEGQGFEGLLGGELQVNQRANQPLQLFGRLNFPSGRYRAYGQDLSLSTGIVSFNGPVNNPYITIRAIRRIEKEDIIVGIDASGLANGLSVKLYSQPNLQQAEALSYLVRGKGLDAETSTSNAALGIALGTAVTNHSGLFEQIEKLPFINDIELDGDDKQISIAGYLSDKVYIKYGIGVIEPINELTVRFYLLSRLWVEAVSGLESSADLYYSFEID